MYEYNVNMKKNLLLKRYSKPLINLPDTGLEYILNNCQTIFMFQSYYGIYGMNLLFVDQNNFKEELLTFLTENDVDVHETEYLCEDNCSVVIKEKLGFKVSY
jgi:hypothetical protein